MKEKYEEILEAIWKADEQGMPPGEFIERAVGSDYQDDLAEMEKMELIRIAGEDIFLTPKGYEHAKRIIRLHRLSHVLLYHVLGIRDHDERERIACKLEHTIATEMEEGVCTLLGHPRYTPEGLPIPPGKCCISGQSEVGSSVVRLTEVRPGTKVRVAYIKPHSFAILERLSGFGIHAGTTFRVMRQSPAIIIKLDSTELALEKSIGDDIYVYRVIDADETQDGSYVYDEDLVDGAAPGDDARSRGLWHTVKGWLGIKKD